MKRKLPPAQVRILRQAIASRDGLVAIGVNWGAADSLHRKGLGTHYRAEHLFRINERGRWALPVEPPFVPSEVPTCSVPGCNEPGTSPVGCGGMSHPLCRAHSRAELLRRGAPYAPEFTERELLDALDSSTSQAAAAKKLGVCVSTLQRRAEMCTSKTRNALERCRAQGLSRRGSAAKPRHFDEQELIEVLDSSMSILEAMKQLHAHHYTIEMRAKEYSDATRRAYERCVERGRHQGGLGLVRANKRRHG